MFIGRENELTKLKAQLSQKEKTAILVYGKRRVGKSTLIEESARSFDGVVINHMCAQSTLAGNIELLSRSISISLGLPGIKFSTLSDIFDFLGSQNSKILLVIDEYQYLKQSGKKNEIDSYMQIIIDHLPKNVKVILCGSYVTVMKELLEEENPLFGRFSEVLHVLEFDYYDASRFYPDLDIKKKSENYAIFGGSPYVLSTIDASSSVKDNIIKYVLPETSILRTYIENVILREIQKTFDIRIFSLIGNGKKRYSDLLSSLGGNNNGLLDKQLKYLIDMETIEKVFPINKEGDKRKQFYSISNNLMRFYFTYIFGNEVALHMLGEEAFFDEYIAVSIDEFVQRRFESIASQYFMRQIRAGKLKGIMNIGSYWYDDAVTKTNGEFDVVLKKKDSYEMYECKFYNRRMTADECEKEIEQVQSIKELSNIETGFICLGGFDFDNPKLSLITGEQLFDFGKD